MSDVSAVGAVSGPIGYANRPGDTQLDPTPRRVVAVSVERRTSVLFTLLWAWVVLPRVVQSIIVPKHRRSVGIDYGGYTAAAALTQNLLRALVFGLCAMLIAGAIGDQRRRPIVPLIVVLAPWTLIAIRGLYAGHAPSVDALLYPVVTIAVWTLAPRITALRTLAHLTALAALISIVMAVVSPPSALFRLADGTVIATDKQIIPAGMLTGFLTQPNNLGQFLVLGLPAVVLLRSRKLRAAYVALGIFTVVWTASRSSMYAIAITGVAALAVVAARGMARRLFAATMIAVAFALVCVVPFVTRSPSAFSGRGLIWENSLPAWQQRPWLGQGSDWYRDIAATSSSIMATAFHGHNQLVQLLVTGGVGFAALIGVLLATAARAALRQLGSGSAFGVLYLIALAGTCLLEVSLALVDNMALLPVVLIPLAVVSFADTDSDAGSGPAQASRERVPRYPAVETVRGGEP
jgi:O-antigen ligase